MNQAPPAVDFFISYTRADRAWAEWVAWQLEKAGYSVTLQAWDFRPGRDFLHEMQRATTTARRTIAILSPDYFLSEPGEAEWRAIFARDPTGEGGLLVPVRVSDFRPSGLLATRIYIDLVGLSATEAVDALLRGVSDRGARPTHEPPFPGASFRPAAAPRFPGTSFGSRHMPFEPFDAKGATVHTPPGFKLIWSTLEDAPTVPNCIAVKVEAFDSLNELLDELFISYLHQRVSPYSYGSEWVLTTNHDKVVAPVAWVRDPARPISRATAEWAASATLEQIGLHAGSSASIADPLSLRAYAVVTDNPRLGRMVRHNPKAIAVLRHHLTVVHDHSYTSGKIQLVLADWLGLGLAGKVLTDRDLTSEELDSLSREYRLEWGRVDDEG